MTRFVVNAPLIFVAVLVGFACGAAEIVMSYRFEGWLR
jgi:hypothetical protein